MISVTFKDKATPAVERMQQQAPAHVQRHATERGDRYHGALVEATPEGRGERPGRLKRAWQADPAGAGAVRVHNDAPHLRYVVQGRGAIVAKPGKVLAFTIDGERLFRHRVGPAAPNAFIEKTLQFEATHDQADADALARVVAGEMR